VVWRVCPDKAPNTRISHCKSSPYVVNAHLNYDGGFQFDFLASLIRNILLRFTVDGNTSHSISTPNVINEHLN
jgi:hypothetical protein